MNILILDDDSRFSELFMRDISETFYKMNSDVRIKLYNSEFLNHDYKGNYSFAFVDIDLNDLNGISLSRKIKEMNPLCDIVFISAKSNLIHSSLSVQPFFFIRKEHYKDDLHVFEELIKEKIMNNAFIQLCYKSTKVTISVHDIIFIESLQHVLIIHTPVKDYYDNRTLKSMNEKLSKYYFVQIHRAFLVNCRYVYSFNKKELVLYKKELLHADKNNFYYLRVSRKYIKDFEEKYQEYLLL